MVSVAVNLGLLQRMLSIGQELKTGRKPVNPKETLGEHVKVIKQGTLQQATHRFPSFPSPNQWIVFSFAHPNKSFLNNILSVHNFTWHYKNDSFQFSTDVICIITQFSKKRVMKETRCCSLISFVDQNLKLGFNSDQEQKHAANNNVTVAVSSNVQYMYSPTYRNESRETARVWDRRDAHFILVAWASVGEDIQLVVRMLYVVQQTRLPRLY